MKNTAIFSIFIFILFSACQPQKMESIVLEVSFENANSKIDTLFIMSEDDEIAIIKGENGSFRDTLNLHTGIYHLKCGDEYTKLYLENGFDLSIHFDYLLFDETIQAKGQGDAINNHLFQRLLNRENNLILEHLLELDSASFYQKIDAFFQQEKDKITTFDLDNNSLTTFFEDIDLTKEEYIYSYIYMKEFNDHIESMTYAPNFTAKDINGNSVSLTDFLGKVVFVDVWASWCRPCLAEVPYIKALQEEYEPFNIEFVGVSMDCEEQYDDWLGAIKEHQIQGVQLIFDNCWEADFAKDYFIQSIPRFLLIDQDGQIIDLDAPRPSSDKIRPLLNQHLTN